MATYLPNSNDYIPKSKSYTPDFKFLADVLGRRQDRYNTNFKQLNQLYGKVVHADLSHEDNIHKRDEYANLLVPKIQQLTGTDFSLQQNVDAAKALFKPFFEDKNLVRDIVYTKRYNGQMQIAENQKNSSLEEERRKYFQDGVLRLQYGMKDFKAGSLDDIMTAEMPEYVENPDIINRSIEHLKNWGGEGKGLEVSDIVFGPDGKWMWEQTNGALLTHRPTGIVDPETQEMTYYNPAANYITSTIGGDPLIARAYATTAYVRARQFSENEENIAKYGSPDAAKRFYMNEVINKGKTESEKIIQEEKVQKEKAEKTKNSWENYLKSNPNLDTEEHRNYLNALAAIVAIDAGIDNQQKILNDISRNQEDMKDLEKIYYQAFMNQSLSTDILSAASQYANLTKKVSNKELNPIYEKQIDFEYKAALKNLELDNAKKLADYNREKEKLANNNALNLGGPGGLKSTAPDAEINLSSYEQENDKIGSNREFISGLSDGPIEKMLMIVEQAYGDLGPGWSSEDNVFNSTGMEVEVFQYTDQSPGEGVGAIEYMTDDNPTNRPGKWVKRFMTWKEAREYFLGQGRNQDDLNNAYQDVLVRYRDKIENDPNMSKPMFNKLNTLISTLEDEIKNDKLTVIELNENNNKNMKETYDYVMKLNPELGDWLEENNVSMFKGDKLLSLDEFNREFRKGFRSKVEQLGLPSEIKTMQEVAAEMNPGLPRSVYLAKYRNYLGSIFTDERIRAAGFDPNNMGMQMMLQTFYQVDPNEVKGTKPANVSDEVWEASLKQVANQQTANFLDGSRNATRMVLQDNFSQSHLYGKSEKAYNNIYNAMNEVLTSPSAGSGSPTYDARRDYMLKNQTDDGSISMTDNWEGSYWHGDAKEDVIVQVQQAFTLINKLDKSYTSVKSGTPSSHVKGDEFGVLEDMVWDDGMDLLINQITMDLENEQEVDKAHRPNMHLTYNENVNGKSAVTIQLDQKYVNKLRSTNQDLNKLLAKEDMTDNTFTIYIESDKWDNPMNMSNLYVSRTKREINTNGEYYHNVPEGGWVKAWQGSDNKVVAQYAETVYNFDTKQYETVVTTTKVLDTHTDRQIDDLMKTLRTKLNEIADANRIAKDKDTK